MHLKHIRSIEEKLAECVKNEFDKGIKDIDIEEMSKAIYMLKEISEAEYYAQAVKSMEEYNNTNELRYYDEWRYNNGRFAPKGKGTRRGYEEYSPNYNMTPDRNYTIEKLRDMDRDIGKMYYTDTSMTNNINRINKEGRSPISRRTYMETKEMHNGNTQHDKDIKLKDLDKYLNELSEDIREMILDATPEEKQLLKTKLSTLVTKL